MSDCKVFLLDRESNALTDRYRLHIRIISNLQTPRIYAGWSVAFEGPSFDTSYDVMVSAICIPPFGFTLYDAARSSAVPLTAGDITSYVSALCGSTPRFLLTLPVVHEHAAQHSLA